VVLPDAKRTGQTCLGRLCMRSFTCCSSPTAVLSALAINSAHAPNPWIRMSMPSHPRHRHDCPPWSPAVPRHSSRFNHQPVPG
jgi:hypothetical protein